MMKLAQRMTECFCSGICASSACKWDILHIGNLADDMRIMARKIDDPTEAPGIVLSASTSVWMPVSRKRVFDFLRDENLRGEWDMLSKDGPMKEMLHIAKGQDRGNCVSILHVSALSYHILCMFLFLVLVFCDLSIRKNHIRL